MIAEIGRAGWEFIVIVFEALLGALALTLALLFVVLVTAYPLFWLGTHMDCWFGGACS
jgi:hypothetical protein